MAKLPEGTTPSAIFFRQSTYVIDAMNATKRIIVREEVWAALSGMREPGMTFSELIEEMIEHEKKRRLLEDIRRIQETEGLVEISRWRLIVLFRRSAADFVNYPDVSRKSLTWSKWDPVRTEKKCSKNPVSLLPGRKAAMSSCSTSMEGVSLSPTNRGKNPEEGCYERSSGRQATPWGYWTIAEDSVYSRSTRISPICRCRAGISTVARAQTYFKFTPG